jgi:hypothetical protein
MLAGADLSNRRPLRAGSADGRVLIHHAGMTGAVSDHLFIGPLTFAIAQTSARSKGSALDAFRVTSRDLPFISDR